MSEVAIRVRNVSHDFGEEDDARRVRALLDTSIEVARRAPVLDRSERLRQEYAAQYRRRAARPEHRNCVFSTRPGTIKQMIPVDEPHPRNPDFVTSAKYTALRNQLYGLLHGEIRKAMQESAMRSDGRRGGESAQ